MFYFIIFILAVIAAISSIVYGFKLYGRMKRGKLYVGNLLSQYVRLDTTKQATYLALLKSKELKKFNKFISPFLKTRKVKISRLKDENLLSAVCILYEWFLAQLMHAYLGTYESLRAADRGVFVSQLTGPEVKELEAVLELYRNKGLNHKTVRDVMHKDMIDNLIPYLLKNHKSVLGKQLKTEIGFAMPMNPIELYIDMYNTRQLGMELIKKEQVAEEINNSDTFITID